MGESWFGLGRPGWTGLGEAKDWAQQNQRDSGVSSWPPLRCWANWLKPVISLLTIDNGWPFQWAVRWLEERGWDNKMRRGEGMGKERRGPLPWTAKAVSWLHYCHPPGSLADLWTPTTVNYGGGVPTLLRMSCQVELWEHSAILWVTHTLGVRTCREGQKSCLFIHFVSCLAGAKLWLVKKIKWINKPPHGKIKVCPCIVNWGEKAI